MTAHARFGGSSAYRWLQCPGSVVLSEKVPGRAANAHMEEGTFAHALAEKALLNGHRTADEYVGTRILHPAIVSTKLVTQEMADAVNVYLAAVWSALDPDTATGETEERFELPIPGAEGEVFGTNDAVVFDDATGRLTIFDYKHGQGKAVFAYDNPQLKFYAAGAVFNHPEWEVKSIECVIVQPRCTAHDERGGVDRWEMPIDDLVDFPWAIEVAVKDAKSDNPTFTPGPQCDWCPASTICTVREKAFLDAAALEVGSIADMVTEEWALPVLPEDDVVVLGALDVEQMARILTAYDRYLTPWVNAIREKLDAMVMAGETVPGRKLVEKVGQRKWVEAKMPELLDTLEVYGLPLDEAMPRKLLTITAMEKVLKHALPADQFAQAKNDLTVNYMVKESSGLTVVDEGDRRPAVAANGDMQGFTFDAEE